MGLQRDKEDDMNYYDLWLSDTGDEDAHTCEDCKHAEDDSACIWCPVHEISVRYDSEACAEWEVNFGLVRAGAGRGAL